MTERKTAVIGREARVRGRVAGDEDLLVFGRVEGEVDLRGALRVEPGGVVRARVRATAVRVAGVVVGELVAVDLVHLCSTARVVGDVRAARVVIEPGAQVAGGLVVEGEARAAEGPRRSFTEPSRARSELPLSGTPSAGPARPAWPRPAPAEPEPAPAPTQDVPAVARPQPTPAEPAAVASSAPSTVRDAPGLATHFVPAPAASSVAHARTEHGAWDVDGQGASSRDEGRASSRDEGRTPSRDEGHAGRVRLRPRGESAREPDAGVALERPTLWPTAPERPTSLEPAPGRRHSDRPQPPPPPPPSASIEARPSLPSDRSWARPTELGAASGRPTLEARGRLPSEADEPAGRPTVLAAERASPELLARALRTSVPSPSLIAAPARPTSEGVTRRPPAPEAAPRPVGGEAWGEGTRVEPAPEDTRTTLAARPGRPLPLVEAVPSSTPPRARGEAPRAPSRADAPAVPAPRELRGTELPSQLPHPSMVVPSAVESTRRRILVRVRRRGDED